MRSAFAALVAGVTVAAGTVGAGCVIVTGSTDGYSVQGTGGDGGRDTGAVSLECVSAADCGDGGNVCCLVINSSFTSATTACQASCSGDTYPVQMCKSTTECGKTGICITQSCSFGSLTVSIPACGMIKGCTTP